MSGKLLFAASIAAVCAAVVAGLVIVGGPGQGQRDRFDARRYLELGTVARALLCELGGTIPGRSLPPELSVDALRVHCSSAGIRTEDLTDDETGQPYVYERKSDQEFSVCASFHDARRTVQLNPQGWYGASFDAETGCVSGWLR